MAFHQADGGDSLFINPLNGVIPRDIPCKPHDIMIIPLQIPWCYKPQTNHWSSGDPSRFFQPWCNINRKIRKSDHMETCSPGETASSCSVNAFRCGHHFSGVNHRSKWILMGHLHHSYVRLPESNNKEGGTRTSDFFNETSEFDRFPALVARRIVSGHPALVGLDVLAHHSQNAFTSIGIWGTIPPHNSWWMWDSPAINLRFGVYTTHKNGDLRMVQFCVQMTLGLAHLVGISFWRFESHGCLRDDPVTIRASEDTVFPQTSHKGDEFVPKKSVTFNILIYYIVYIKWEMMKSCWLCWWCCWWWWWHQVRRCYFETL